MAAPGTLAHRFAIVLVGSWSFLQCCNVSVAHAQENPAKLREAVPRVTASGGLRVQTQGAGTANTISGYVFAPLGQDNSGNLAFLDFSANLNLGGVAPQVNSVNAGVSTRIGYRWLDSKQSWIYGVNAGVDTRPAYSQYAFQAGVGAEALSRSLELRLNGYIPFANTSEFYATGWTNASLANDRLFLDGFNQYVVAVGGADIEVGRPLSTWKNGSLWAYAAYYYLNGDYLSGSSGVRGRAEVRVGSQLAVGATVSYDNLFSTQATGYIRYGAKPLAGSAKDAVAQAERNFLALRGLPVVREGDIRLDVAQENLPNSVAINPSTGQPWVVRCTGTTNSSYTVSCTNASLSAMLAVAGAGDVLLAGGGASADLSTSPLENGRPTLRLAPGTQLATSGNAPTLATQFGPAGLTPIFGSTVGNRAAFNNGVLSIGSNTSIIGFNFTNTSITNYSTSNVLISGNTFIGSYTDNPSSLATAQSFGNINVSANALPAIQLTNVSNLTISNNSFLYPQVQTYLSQQGTVDGGGMNFVCNQNGVNTSGLCLSGNAIRLNNVAGATLSNNYVDGALDEAFRINNPSGSLVVNANTITNMRMGPDSNIGTAIIIGQNQGTSSITISNNTVTNNSPGVYPVVTSANQSGVPVATGPVIVGAITYNPVNNIDPIEVGLCRGSLNYPRFNDLYADAGFSGNCSGPARMNISVYGNTISLPAITSAIRQDGDGIDFNLGGNSVLNASIYNNVILTLGGSSGGDNGITFDLRGNTQATASISDNSIGNTRKEAIDFTFTNNAENNSPGSGIFTISGNTFSGTTAARGLLSIDMINNAGIPVSSFGVTGSGNNTQGVADADIDWNNFNSGPYANLYLNGLPQFPPSP